MVKIIYKDLEPEERKELFNKICDDIIQKTNEYRQRFNEIGYVRRGEFKGELNFNYGLGDIGDFIGKAIGQNTCKGEKDLNILNFDKEFFVSGFYHGYSIYDGTH